MLWTVPFFTESFVMNRVLSRLFIFTALVFMASSLYPCVAAEDVPKDRVVVMYFHRTERCPTCLRMGSYAEEAVKKGFAEEIKAQKVSFHLIDFEDEKNGKFTQGYKIQGPTLIVAQVSGAKVMRYKRLDEMWTRVRDKQDFLNYVQREVKEYLK